MEKQPVLKTTMFGGFEKKSVLDYIYEITESTQEAQDKLNAQLEEVSAAREKMTEELKAMESRLEGVSKEREQIADELTGEKKRTGELGDLIDSLNDEIRRQSRIVQEKDMEIAAHVQRAQELLDKNAELESKKEEVERASVYIGELLLRTRSDSEKILADASRQAEELVKEANASLEDVYEQFRTFRGEMDNIQAQIDKSLSAVKERFADISHTVEQAEHSLRDTCYKPDLKLVTDEEPPFPLPSQDDGLSTNFFRGAAEN